jgi:hypothetical protein
MKIFLSMAAYAGLFFLSATGAGFAADPSTPPVSIPPSSNSPNSSAPSLAMIDQPFIAKVREWSNSNVVQLTLSEQNKKHASIDQAKIDALDKQWREERKSDDQPLITAVLSSPLSGYLTRIQARSLGLYTEIFVMDNKGLNAGQSSVTSDYWQGDEDKWQKTFLVGPEAVFIDKPEYEKTTGTWRVQLNMTLAQDQKPVGSVTVEVNLTELERRRALSLAQN